MYVKVAFASESHCRQCKGVGVLGNGDSGLVVNQLLHVL